MFEIAIRFQNPNYDFQLNFLYWFFIYPSKIHLPSFDTMLSKIIFNRQFICIISKLPTEKAWMKEKCGAKWKSMASPHPMHALKIVQIKFWIFAHASVCNSHYNNWMYCVYSLHIISMYWNHCGNLIQLIVCARTNAFGLQFGRTTITVSVSVSQLFALFNTFFISHCFCLRFKISKGVYRSHTIKCKDWFWTSEMKIPA